MRKHLHTIAEGLGTFGSRRGSGLVPAGGRFDLPGQVVLDAYTGREWLVVSASPEPSGTDALLDEMRGLLPDPSAHAGETRFVTEITRGAPPR